MEFKLDFFKEEVRSGFLVTEKRKKVWATELNLMEEFDRVCKKHNLKWFVEYGTLLGAARHHGFVPWDDDIDISMFRDDYMKLLAVASDEFKEPYFFQNTYTDVLVTAFSKLRDSRTTAIEFPDVPSMNQGIFIDIFPLDDATPLHNDNYTILKIQTELWRTISQPEDVLQALNQPNPPFLLEPDLLLELLGYDIERRMLEFETFNLNHFGKSEMVNLITSEITHRTPSKNREYFEDIVYLPFENTYVPVPKEYDKILTIQYGDWHEFVQGGSAHEDILLDPDNPYTKYFQK